ncbi:MAG: hypothetical protein ABSB34_04130 [Candidatus Limnocylindrales bacterium]
MVPQTGPIGNTLAAYRSVAADGGGELNPLGGLLHADVTPADEQDEERIRYRR